MTRAEAYLLTLDTVADNVYYVASGIAGGVVSQAYFQQHFGMWEKKGRGFLGEVLSFYMKRWSTPDLEVPDQ